jgi:hypothetical protein
LFGGAVPETSQIIGAVLGVIALLVAVYFISFFVTHLWVVAIVVGGCAVWMYARRVRERV